MYVLDHKTVVTRKEHECWGCGRIFPAGSELKWIQSVDEGQFSELYWCATCREYWLAFMDYGDEIDIGDLRNNDPDGWEDVREEIEG